MKPQSLILILASLALCLAGASLPAQDTIPGTNAAVSAEAPATTNTTPAATNERSAALAAAVAALATNPPAATPSAASSDTQDNRLNERSFQIIQQRNIFNPNRQPRRVARDTGPPPPRTDYFTLNGIMTYENRGYAFFDGSSGQYRRTLAPTESIGGYKIAEITNNLVKLAAASNQLITLRVGMQMRRQGEGPWKLEARGESDSAASGASGSESNADPNAVSPIFSGAQEDIVKKLMLRRAEEEKKAGGGTNNEEPKND